MLVGWAETETDSVGLFVGWMDGWLVDFVVFGQFINNQIYLQGVIKKTLIAKIIFKSNFYLCSVKNSSYSCLAKVIFVQNLPELIVH